MNESKKIPPPPAPAIPKEKTKPVSEKVSTPKLSDTGKKEAPKAIPPQVKMDSISDPNKTMIGSEDLKKL
ncbi:MAG: cytochrome bc complex cytochrome b subunit [Marine Group I thaumarchaeote]|nr:MAG: cytochrome bc complex cytochrome b subunit [Marine Group I thaumarchaeote]